MPIITTPLGRNDSGPAVADLQRALLKFGAPIADAEKNAQRFGDSTMAAVIAFRNQHRLPPVVGTAAPFDVAVGRLLNVAAAAVDGNRAALRIAVRESIAAASNATPQENYWLARYAVIALDYTSAREAALRAPQLSDLVNQIIEAPLDLRAQSPKPPEVPFPENFYTHRYKLLPQETLDELLGRTASTPPGSSARMMRRRMVGRDGEGDWPDLPDEPEPEPPPSTQPDPARQAALIEAAQSWLVAVDHWQFGNEEFNKRRYARAVSAYTACQKAALNYFAKYYADVDFTNRMRRLTLEELVNSYVVTLINNETRWSSMWDAIRQRRIMLSLQELGDYDWAAVTPSAVSLLVLNLGGGEAANPDSVKALRQRSLDRPLLILATIMVPLARAEANRLRRQYDAAERDLRRVLRPYQVRAAGTPPTVRDVWLTCDFIELPFARLTLSETLRDKADAQYKARMPVAEVDASALATAGAEYRNRLPDPGNRNQTEPFQSLQAAKTYLSIIELFSDEIEYVNRVNQGVDTLWTKLDESLARGDVTSAAFQTLGKDITIPTVQPAGETLPGLDERVAPHEPLLKFQPPQGQTVMREINPRVFTILLEVQARLLQIWFWFNYLGYADDYVPLWRFPFLLDRARYFAEHAKSAQREYLNFLNNAEHEEFQELSATQNVEMEKSNVHIETARVDQVRLEVEASKASQDLAQLTARDAEDRFEAYSAMDEKITELEQEASFWSSVSNFAGMVAGLAAIPLTGGASGVIAAGQMASWFTGEMASAAKGDIPKLERGYEKFSLGLAAQEAGQAALIANRQLAAAQAGLVVAGLQRQAALLRHEFAVQNLNFLRNRTLNAELWYRLSGAIRSVADTYLRYAIETAFLAEQAYEFEVDKRINVIRFDYDASDLGEMLAGDFLLSDLDTLEQDLIIGQRLRQQQVRYVLSLAREFPEALQELRENGQMTFSLRLEQLERRFPGLYNLRIASVDVLPVALMDSTRFSLELTHLGTGQVRLKAQSDTPPGTESTSPLNTTDADDWLNGLRTEWPVKIRVTGPETAVYSGLTRQEVAGLPSFFAANQRGAFEGLPGASSWRIDLSMKENRIIPDTLADMLITFTLSGYYDASLRRAIDAAPRWTTAMTTWFSAHQTFPDAFFEFNRSGRMDWQISPDFLSLQGSIGALRNVAVLLPPGAKRPQLGRLICSYAVEFEVTSNGKIRLLTRLPNVQLSVSQLTLDAQIGTPSPGNITWDFGDGTGIVATGALPHTYAKPGRYEVTMRILSTGHLVEYRAAVVVSRKHAIVPPLIVVPRLRARLEGGKIKVMPSLQSPADQSLSVKWRVDDLSPESGGEPVAFRLDLPTEAEGSKRHTLRFTAVRQLKGRFHSQQRYAPAVSLRLDGLHLATNRTFDPASGAETTTSPNTFAQHVFEAGTLSPTDRWTLELPLEDNPCLVSVSPTDIKQYDLSELADAALSLEYNVSDA